MKDTSRIDRRKFLKLAGAAGIVAVGAACAPAAVPTATPTKAPSGAAATPQPAGAASPAALKPEAVRAQLYEAAKKEGQVVMYSTGTSKDTEAFRTVFSKSYPGIEIKEFMGTAEQILEKVLTEFKAGKVNADYVLVPVEQWATMIKEGMVEKWDPPEKPNFPASAVDPNGFYITEQATIHVISYNTQLVPAADSPKNYQDLLKPVFKGKLGLESKAYSWFAQRMEIWGKDKAVEYCKKLAEQQPKFITGNTALADSVVSGEVWAAVNVYQHRVEEQKGKGAPVKWAVDDPTGCEPNSAGIMKGSPHPNAAKLFYDWKLSKEGQEITLKALSRYSIRTDLPIPPELKVNVKLPTMQTALATPEAGKLFKEIFGLV